MIAIVNESRSSPEALAARVEQILQRSYKGDVKWMADSLSAKPAVIHDILKAKAKPHELEGFLKNACRNPRIDGRWLRGEAEEPAAEEGPIQEYPAPDPDPTAVRVSEFITHQYGGSYATAAATLGVSLGMIRLVCERKVQPPDELLVKILGAPLNPPVSDDWLLKGEGPMFLYAKAGDPAANPGLPLILELARKLEDAGRQVAEAKAEIAKAREAMEADATARTRLAQRINSLEASIAGQVLQAIDGKFKVARQGIIDAAAQPALDDLRSFAAIVTNRFKDHAAKFEAQAATNASMATLFGRVKLAEERVGDLMDCNSAIASRLRSVEERKTAPAAPKVVREPDVDADERMSLRAWFRLPGDHGETIPEGPDRKMMGERLSALYSFLGLREDDEAEGQTNSRSYRVADMRTYLDYARSGEPMGQSGWARFYRRANANAEA